MKCNGITKNGKRCKKVTNVDFCHHHKNCKYIEKPKNCPICLCSLHQTTKPLSCGHWFHRSCVQKLKKPNCPLCDAKIEELDDPCNGICMHDAVTNARLAHIVSVMFQNAVLPEYDIYDISEVVGDFFGINGGEMYESIISYTLDDILTENGLDFVDIGGDNNNDLQHIHTRPPDLIEHMNP